MRPISSAYNPLKHPLNHVLGRESHVRILRLLSDQIEPLGISTIAQKAGLTSQGATKALDVLRQKGFVHETGGSRQRQYEMRSGDRLARALVQLFEAERHDFEELMSQILNAVSTMTTRPESAWMEPVDNRSGRQVEVGFMAGIKDVASIKSNLRRRLFPIESAFDLTINLEGYSRADLAFVSTENVQLLFGRSVNEQDDEVGIKATQLVMDQRARAWAKELAKLVRDDSSLITEARVWAENKITGGAGTASHDIVEWVNILSGYSKRQILEFLVSESPRSHRLRQSSPFLAVLNQEQKERLNRAWERSSHDS